MRTRPHHFSIRPKQRGFSMLEILITLFIIAIALLGTAGLQVYAMRVNQDGQFRTQAVFLVADIAERMEANKSAATAGNYVVAETDTPGATPTDCATVTCDATTLAVWDINQWESAIIELGLPQASWEIAQTVAGNPSTYTMRISWTDRGSNIPFAYTATRTVSN